MSAAHNTSTLTIELPEGILSEGATSSESLATEVLIAVAIEGYREGPIFQGQARWSRK